MAIATIKQLLETGVHFGHQVSDWNPRMGPYIFTARNKIHIIDLEKTLDKIKEAYNFVRDTVAQGSDVLFVCTKKQGSDIIESEAKRCGMFYVADRWLGGTLTNFQTIRKSIARLKELEGMKRDGTINRYTKKEILKMEKDLAKLEKNLGGIKDMDDLPGAVFIVDPKRERIAVREARKLGIPVVAIADSNCDPDEIDLPDDFIIDRVRPRQHMSFGFGIHRYVGNRLTELQWDILWEEILKRYPVIEVIGEATRTYSNFIYGFRSLPVRILACAGGRLLPRSEHRAANGNSDLHYGAASGSVGSVN